MCSDSIWLHSPGDVLRADPEPCPSLLCCFWIAYRIQHFPQRLTSSCSDVVSIWKVQKTPSISRMTIFLGACKLLSLDWSPTAAMQTPSLPRLFLQQIPKPLFLDQLWPAELGLFSETVHEQKQTFALSNSSFWPKVLSLNLLQLSAFEVEFFAQAGCERSGTSGVWINFDINRAGGFNMFNEIRGAKRRENWCCPRTTESCTWHRCVVCIKLSRETMWNKQDIGPCCEKICDQTCMGSVSRLKWTQASVTDNLQTM